MDGIKYLIIIGAIVVFLILFSIANIVAIAWVHYPCGIFRAIRLKKKREKEEQNAKND